VTDETPRAPTVFLSYASEDREAARRIGAALPAYGLEVWYDESELGGGDAWDQKIRRQIRECDYFMALVSARTEARREGYFRREWRLAAERTLDMADDHPFLLPVTIDDTDATGARVPEKFQTVQWLKVPDGNPTPSLEAVCRRLAGGGVAAAAPRVSIHPGGQMVASQTVAPSQPDGSDKREKRNKSDKSKEPFTATPFPVHQPGQNMRFGVEVSGWTFRNGYQLFKLLPKWVRLGIIVYVVLVLLSHGRSDRHDDDVSAETQKKLEAVANQYKKDPSMNLGKLGALVAQEFGDSAQGNGVSVLAFPFAAPSGDESATKLADAAFAQTYTRMSVVRHAHLVAGDAAATSCALDTLLGQGRAKQAQYVLCGSVDAGGSAQSMTVTLAQIKGSKVLWSNQYPLAGADPAKIALDVVAHVPESGEDDD
jgi:TolB-like protein